MNEKNVLGVKHMLSLANIPSLKELDEVKTRLDEVEKSMLQMEDRLIGLIEKLEEAQEIK